MKKVENIENQLKNFTKNDYTIPNIIQEITKYTCKWKFSNKAACAWYRGQDSSFSPNPGIFRENFDEFHLNTTFRNRASALKDVPETDRIDKWLFLIQHYHAPTRLLDWTENLMNALFFALDSYNDLCECKKTDIEDNNMQNPTIWVIHPYKMNEYSNMDYFPNTWTHKYKKRLCKSIETNSGIEHFRLAWHPPNKWKKIINMTIVKYPIAVHANFLDMRIFHQQSCFTIHGTDERDFVSQFTNEQLIEDNYLLKFEIPKKYAKKLYKELLQLGLKKTGVYPDLSHFALDLKQRFNRNYDGNKIIFEELGI